MASTTETGNAKNVANFEDLISFCTGYGASYNPSKASIKLAALTTKRTDAVNALAKVNSFLPPWTNAINAREEIFNPLSKLITRVVNAVVASDVPKEIIADVKTIARKLQGKRASAKIENMDKLIQLLTAQAGYTPNEPELTVAGLTTVFTNMKTTNTDAVNAYTPLSNSRIDRNKILYDETTGLVTVAGDVKAYVKSVFGGTSPQYKQVSKLKFTTPKK